MLVREPTERASLGDISRHPWMLQDGPVGSPTSVLPLVCRESLSEEDHCHIVQRIVEGKIATKDEIVGYLENSVYNHITATYYLLAERLLRKRKDASTQSISDSEQSKMDQKPVLSPLALSPRLNVPRRVMQIDADQLPSVLTDSTSYDPILSPVEAPPSLYPNPGTPKSPTLHSEISLLVYRCALIHEDSGEAVDNDLEEEAEMTTISQSHSDSEVAEDDGSELAELTSVRTFGNLLEIPTTRGISKQMMTGGNSGRTLVSVRSSPQLLNEICEEAEHDEDGDHARSEVPQIVHASRRNSTDTPRRRDRMHRVHHRTIGAIAPRVASCSSSDASDTDDVEQRGNKQKQKIAASTPGAGLRNIGRRDSSEHSSDNDNQPASWPSCAGDGDGNCGTVCGSACGGGNTGGSKSGSEGKKQNDGNGRKQTSNGACCCRCKNSVGGVNSAVLQVRLEDIESQSGIIHDEYIPEPQDYCLSSPRNDATPCHNNRLSNIIRFHSMEFGCGSGSGFGLIEIGKPRLKRAGKMRCHSTIDIGCAGSRAVAAALLAKLSSIGLLERRSHSVSCLRARKVSM